MLDFVVVYGLILMPMGAIVVVEHWLFPRLGWNRCWAGKQKLLVNIPAMIAWLGSVAGGLVASSLGWIHLFFVFIPVWIVAAVTYIVLAGLWGARAKLPADNADHDVAASQERSDAPASSAMQLAETSGSTVAGRTAGQIAVVSLIACLAVRSGCSSRTSAPNCA